MDTDADLGFAGSCQKVVFSRPDPKSIQVNVKVWSNQYVYSVERVDQ